jgi:uracil-DNA glycosylase family 4
LYGDGNRERRIMVIGEAPGEQEDRTGKPFQGKSGNLLRAELAKHRMEDVYITNVVKCRPPDNRKPEKEEITACSRYLQDEFEKINPTHVLLLGASALKAVLNKAGITEINGKVIEKDGVTYVPCFHPAAILRDPSKKSLFSIAIKRFADACEGRTKTDEAFEFQIVSAATFDAFLSAYERCREFSFDLETTGLDWWRDDINCIGFAFDHGENWILPWERASVLPRQEMLKLIQYLSINQRKRVAVAQNGKFDNLFLLANTGFRFRLDDDTMLIHHVIDENLPHGLKENARLYLGAPDYDLTTAEKKGNTSAYKLFRYCALDCRYTLQLIQIFRRMLHEDESSEVLYRRLVMPAARAFEIVELERFWVNIEQMAKVEKQQRLEMEETERQLNKMLGRTINWNSTDQVATALYGDLNLDVHLTTDKGKPSTSESALIDHDHPVVKLLQKYRECQKFISTYIEGWRELMFENRLAISFKLHGTVTGRYSSRIHSIPRDGTIRNLIEAPPGWVFVAADYSQIELRIVAHLSRDPKMQMIFRTGGDIHRETAISVSGIQEPTSEDRKKAKAINFGFIYGMAAPKFQGYAKEKYGVDLSMRDSIEFRENYFSTFARIQPWHEKQRQLVRADGQVRSLTGRIRHLPMVHSSEREARSEAERQAINTVVQGFGGDLKAMALVELHEELPLYSFRIYGEHHDAILMAVRVGYEKEHLPRIRKIMEHPKLLDEFGIKLSVPILVDIEVGPWGKGVKWNEDRILNSKNVATLPQEVRLQVQPEAAGQEASAPHAARNPDRSMPRRAGPRKIVGPSDTRRPKRIRSSNPG